MNRRLTSAAVLAAALGVFGPDAGPVRASGPALAELWQEPAGERDLYWGIGGERLAPPPSARYALEGRDDGGFSVSYDVTDPEGTEWSAKIGPEAQTEVVVSRILWGLGYHQPPLYYLPSWRLALREGGTRLESEARFRPKLKTLKRLDDGDWRWAQNPFVGRRELHGLLVVLVMLNSTDLKDDNNSTYAPDRSWGRQPARWFVVRDVGASLGETGRLYPRRNWLEGFERAGFLREVRDGRVEFEYEGRHRDLLAAVSAADLQWAAARMRRITARQWRDAFRAGNYAEPVAARFIARIQQKIAQAAELRPDPPRVDRR